MEDVRAFNYDGYLLGTLSPPPAYLGDDDLPNPAYAVWRRIDQYIVHWLMNSIIESMLGHIVNCRSSLEIWHILH